MVEKTVFDQDQPDPNRPPAVNISVNGKLVREMDDEELELALQHFRDHAPEADMRMALAVQECLNFHKVMACVAFEKDRREHAIKIAAVVP